MNDLKKAQDEFWSIYKEYFNEYNKLNKVTEKMLDESNGNRKKELTSKMLKKVEKIKVKYNIDDLKIEMKDIHNFEKQYYNEYK